MPIASINPATGETIKTFEAFSDSEVEDRLERAEESFYVSRRTTFPERAARMTQAAQILEEKKKLFGEIMTTEIGKPIKGAIAEAEECAWVCRYYAENAERFLADEMVPSDATRSFIRYQPLGPVLAVMPWNFPFWQVFRFAAPALMAGNVALLKHASNVTACALAIEDTVEGMESLTVGNPMDDTVQVGPLATAQILADFEEQVRKTVELGARVLTGGKRLAHRGYYYPPTVLTDIPKDSPAYREELFGPVASLFRASDIDQAITLANDTSFGLGASAWTNDTEEQSQFIDGIEAGCVFINGMVASDPRLPFGGVKHSGYGRELGVYGIREFVNIKTVWVK